jgi:AAA15 family ATPase/GTPase
MLTKFKVSNFKSFNQEFVFDLREVNGYSFNSECIKNGVVNNALIYGHNGVGKSNLALALFDILEHLTERNKNESEYEIYLNAYNKSNVAEFYYEFLINSNKVVYEYKKTDYKTIVYEKFIINDVEFAYIDRRTNSHAIIKFKGAETLKTEVNNNELSILKYVKNNTELEKNSNNEIFYDFFKFIEGMLFFRSLRDNMFLGSEEYRGRNTLEDIVEKKNVEDFEIFLNNAGIYCKLKVVEDIEKKT